MAYEFRLPDLGEGVYEGEIVRWLVQAGETVKADQELVEVMTDKVTAALPAPVAGVVTGLRGNPGDVVPVGHVLVTIEPNGAGDPQAGHPHHNDSAPSAGRLQQRTPAEAPLVVPPAPLAVPAVRRLARDLGVDLAAVSGTGPGGRITEEDVRAATAGTLSTDETPEAPAPESAFAGGATADEAPPEEGGIQRIPLRGLRRAIAEHLQDAHRTTAPYTFVEEADFTELVRLRERVQPMARQQGVRLTYLPFIIAAVGMALREHPHVNATVDGEAGDLLVHREQHVAVAVHTDQGLVVPVIRSVERRNLLDIARELERLTEAARSGRLTRDELYGGTFSVSSLGAVGGILGTPVLNTPQVAVLGVHKIAPRAVVRDGNVVARQMGNLSLTLDHRYIDGYIGAQFTETLVRYIEDPAVMLFWLAEIRT